MEIYLGSDNSDGDLLGASVGVSDIFSITGAPGNAGVMTTVAGPTIGEVWNIDVDLNLYPDSELTRISIKRFPQVPPVITSLGEFFYVP